MSKGKQDQEIKEMNINFIHDGDIEKCLKFIQIYGASYGTTKAKKFEDRLVIYDYWTWYFDNEKDFNGQIDYYYNKFQGYKKNKEQSEFDFNECLLVKIGNVNDENVEKLLQKINELKNKDYMPYILFLLDEIPENGVIPCLKELKKVPEKQKKKKKPNFKYYIDETKIKLVKFDNNFSIEYRDYHEITKILFRYFSIYNELGDFFALKENKNDMISYNINFRAYPDTLNIMTIGRIRQGKSATVNFFSGEKKANELGAGTTTTKKFKKYQINESPIFITDIPGIEGEETIKLVVNQLEKYRKGLKIYKDDLHLIFYVISASEIVKFISDEIKVFKELINHEKAKIIYILTKTDKDLYTDVEERTEFINKINKSIKQLLDKDIETSVQVKTKISKKMEASENNCAFVNYYENGSNPKCGTKELVEKVIINFKDTESYKNQSKIIITKKSIKEIADLRKSRAKAVIDSYKTGNGFWARIGVIFYKMWRRSYVENEQKNIAKTFDVDFKQIMEYSKGKRAKENKENIIESSSCYDIIPMENFLDDCYEYYTRNVKDFTNYYLKAVEYLEKLKEKQPNDDEEDDEEEG